MSAFTKFAAKVIGFGAKIVSKAFGQAYREAAQASKSGKTAKETAKSFRKGMQKKMLAKEAEEILVVTPETEIDEIVERYEHLFKANNDSKGGSFYIQSKVHNAFETLKVERQNDFNLYYASLNNKSKEETSKEK